MTSSPVSNQARPRQLPRRDPDLEEGPSYGESGSKSGSIVPGRQYIYVGDSAVRHSCLRVVDVPEGALRRFGSGGHVGWCASSGRGR